jgi:hypothetical protein
VLDLLSQLLKFMRVYRKFWLAPVIVGLLVLGGLLVAVEGSVFAPLIYALF